MVWTHDDKISFNSIMHFRTRFNFQTKIFIQASTSDTLHIFLFLEFSRLTCFNQPTNWSINSHVFQRWKVNVSSCVWAVIDCILIFRYSFRATIGRWLLCTCCENKVDCVRVRSKMRCVINYDLWSISFHLIFFQL